MPAKKPVAPDPDDFFADTRMSFGEHLEELRERLLKALKGLLFCLLIGFVLDGIGYGLGWENFGIGRPVFHLITQTVEDQVRDFYGRRLREKEPLLAGIAQIAPDELARIAQILEQNDGDMSALSAADRRKLLGKPETVTLLVARDDLAKHLGPAAAALPPTIELKVGVFPAEMNALNMKGEGLLQSRKYLTTLSVQEPLMVYFKVSLLCGLVLGSPYIFYQIWAFVAAGLYPHEKRYVHLYLPASVGLFILGIVICQFLVLPGAVRALLAFNNFLDVDPDIRLNEWLGFAIILPLVFGLSFQTPLGMLFLNRLGMFGWEDYLARWRGAVMILALFAAIITPTPDAITMLYLFVPMFGLYMLGVLICKYFPPSYEEYSEEDAQVAV